MPLTEKQINALFERGNNFIRAGNLAAAVNDYTTVLAEKPDFAPAYFNRAFARQHGQDDIDNAIADYSRAIELNPNFAEAYANRAIAYTQRRDLPAAIRDYTAAIHLQPGMSQAYSNRGEAYFLIGEYAAAAADFRKAHDLKPGYRYAIAGLAVSLYMQDEGDEAARLWRSLITRNENFADAAWAQHELGWDDALADAARDLIESLE